MCLAIPGKIKEIKGGKAVISYPGEERTVLIADEPVKVGDFVMVQMGVVIKILSEEEAKVAAEAWKL